MNTTTVEALRGLPAPPQQPRLHRNSVLGHLEQLNGPALFAISAIGYWALTYVGYSLPYLPGLASPFWPSAGLAVVMVMVARSRPGPLIWVTAGVVVGEAFTDYVVQGSPLLQSLGFALANLVYIPLAWLIQRLGLYDRGLVNRVSDTVVFLVIAVAMGFTNGALALLVAVAYGFG